MNKIKCQAKHSQPVREDGSGGGCYTCGGYGFLVEKRVTCTKCNKEAWIRPGAYTAYVGKMFTSFDGIKFVYIKDMKVVCEECQ